ncbi:MAG: ATP-binding protein [Longimicrobiales bacterium]|nr:ATP-binding protein [Longimicrobiales bacterium]
MSPEPDDRGIWQKVSYDQRVLLLALVVGLPGVAVSLALVWLGPFSPTARWTATVVLPLEWLGLAWMLRDEVVHPLRTLANVLAAFREGDFSIRARVHDSNDSLALAYRELNALEEILREQRLGAVEASALLQRVMGEIDVAVFAFDEARKVRLLNRAATRLLGRPEEEALGRTAAELRLGDVLEGPAPRTIELSHPGGTGRWEVRRSVVRQEGQRLDLVVLSDLSRALREEEREAWKRLVRVLGHEINNSLAPIKSIAASLRHIMAREPRPSDWEEDVARGLDVVAGRAESLSRFMAAYARLARLPPPELGPVDVEEWVRHVARLETRLDVDVRPGPPAVIQADRDQLEQALINLVGNAVDAVRGMEGDDTGEESGTEDQRESGGVEQAPDEPAESVVVEWRVLDGRIEVVVEDRGPGISETTNLFVPFYTTKPGGSGIGLVLSRQIVEAHGGTLELENREDTRGARARMAVPV